MIAYVVVVGRNITELLYLTLRWDGQNFIAIGAENLIGFLNSIDEYIFEIIEDEALLCTQCIALKN